MTIGKAYGFLDCNATLEDIRMELPDLRKAAQTPSELELFVMDIPAQKGTATALGVKINEARESGMKYVIDATYPRATNKMAADEVAGILNQAYNSPLYKEGKEFSGAIIYEENGNYTFRE